MTAVFASAGWGQSIDDDVCFVRRVGTQFEREYGRIIRRCQAYYPLPTWVRHIQIIDSVGSSDDELLHRKRMIEHLEAAKVCWCFVGFAE